LTTNDIQVGSTLSMVLTVKGQAIGSTNIKTNAEDRPYPYAMLWPASYPGLTDAQVITYIQRNKRAGEKFIFAYDDGVEANLNRARSFILDEGMRLALESSWGAWLSSTYDGIDGVPLAFRADANHMETYHTSFVYDPTYYRQAFCPGYRGRIFDLAMERLAVSLDIIKPEVVVFDIECYYNALEEKAWEVYVTPDMIKNCTRCGSLTKLQENKKDLESRINKLVNQYVPNASIFYYNNTPFTYTRDQNNIVSTNWLDYVNGGSQLAYYEMTYNSTTGAIEPDPIGKLIKLLDITPSVTGGFPWLTQFLNCYNRAVGIIVDPDIFYNAVKEFMVRGAKGFSMWRGIEGNSPSQDPIVEDLIAAGVQAVKDFGTDIY